MTGPSVLITGCSSGIGRAAAGAFAADGANVWATARRVEDIRDLAGERTRLLELDVCDPDSVERAVERAGPIDVLVNNAGFGVEGAVEEVHDEELLAQFDTNVFGPWRLCRSVLPGMRARGRGVIVNVSSFAGRMPYPGMGAYRASKFALEALSWTLFLEVARFGIRVVSVQPGLVASDFESRSMRRASGMVDGNPYEPMRAAARRAYAGMSPSAMSSATVARAIVDAVRNEDGPFHVPIGDDAVRMLQLMDEGDGAFLNFLREIGFDWLPQAAADANQTGGH